MLMRSGRGRGRRKSLMNDGFSGNFKGGMRRVFAFELLVAKFIIALRHNGKRVPCACSVGSWPRQQ